MKTKRRGIGLLVALILAFSLLPSTAWAAQSLGNDGQAENAITKIRTIVHAGTTKTAPKVLRKAKKAQNPQISRPAPNDFSVF